MIGESSGVGESLKVLQGARERLAGGGGEVGT